MKFQAAQRSVFGSKMIDSMDQESVETEITHAKWLVWHGKSSNAVERIKALVEVRPAVQRIRLQRPASSFHAKHRG